MNLSEIRIPMVIYLGGIHLIALAGIPLLFQAQLTTLFVCGFLLYVFGGLGITAGAHRLWAHRSYKAAFPVRMFLMIASSVANQGPLYHWVRDHRVHHLRSETDGDPHNAKRGFFFAHMGWLLVKKHPKVREAGLQLNFEDVLADPLVRIQLKFDPWFNLFFCFALPTYLATALWGEAGYTAFVVCVWRYLCTLHYTWLVNSAAHLWGDRPYDPSINPAENLGVAILAMGEGWHNWHHAYPWDYAASEFGVSVQYNPTKLFIDTCAKLGLVWDRKRATGTWERAKAKRENKGHAEAVKPHLGG